MRGLMRMLSLRNLTLFVSISNSTKQSYKQYLHTRSLLNMNEVHLQYDEGSDKFKLSLRYVNPELKLDRQFNFNRRVDEPISNFLGRMHINIKNYMLKKLKKQNRDCMNLWIDLVNDTENKSIKFVKNDSILDGNITCRSILEDPSDVKLVIFDTEYTLKRNVPYVDSIELSSCILAGFPTYPAKFESLYTNTEKSIFTWYKEDKNEWIPVGNGYLYTPNISDVECKLKVNCTPRNDTQIGLSIEAVSKNKVTPGPGLCPFETRQAFTTNKLSGKSFRVVTYNILANKYSETDVSKDVLYPYCPEYALSMDYRKVLILKELIGYNFDIVCLQEVDKKIYENDLALPLHTLNYDSIYNLKNDIQEGLAIIYNRERFDKLSNSSSVMGQNTDFKEFNFIWSQIQNETVKEAFKNRNSIVQTIVLQSKENSEILIVGNTHLYFKPDADLIRLLQAYYGLTYLQKLANEMKKKNPECNVSILFCGDFNSSPVDGVYQLMTQKYVPKDYADWKFAPNEHVENVSLEHDLNLSSACGTPEYTNYTAAFSGCLDYIFYEKDHLEVEQVIPMPSNEELSLYTALPSVVFPSDHISLCVDLKWSK